MNNLVKNGVMWKLVVCVFLVQAACFATDEVHVQSYVLPKIYSHLVEWREFHYTVRATALIGKDGEVEKVVGPITPENGFWSPYMQLVYQTSKSLCQWTFVLPSDQESFPVKHTVEFVFKIEGKPVWTPKQRYTIQLPHRVEFTSPPQKEEEMEKGTFKGPINYAYITPINSKNKPVTYNCSESK